MTDLQINIALALAMGWIEINHALTSAEEPNFEVVCGEVKCWDTDRMNWRKFDYRDPVIFDALVAHWHLQIDWFSGFPDAEMFVDINIEHGSIFTRPKSQRHLAAALCVIDAVKRGVK